MRKKTKKTQKQQTRTFLGRLLYKQKNYKGVNQQDEAKKFIKKHGRPK